MKIAVIDLGTNTCNLLVATLEDGNYEILYQGKVGVKLGKGGIHKNELTPEALQRALNALHTHQATIKRFEAEKTIAIATSAVRDAANKADFCYQVKAQTGIELKVISGDEEAQTIFNGVVLALQNLDNNSLILDIGGGSNEFILPEQNSVCWKQSFPLGMARVVEQFPMSDPILESEIEAIENWFSQGLDDLWQQMQRVKTEQLIGCSGAFDTLADLIDNTPPGTRSRISKEISMAEFNRVATQIIHSTKSEREQLKAMEPLRIEMIVPAFLFIRLILKTLNINTIIQTDFALREGVLKEWINH